MAGAWAGRHGGMEAMERRIEAGDKTICDDSALLDISSGYETSTHILLGINNITLFSSYFWRQGGQAGRSSRLRRMRRTQ